VRRRRAQRRLERPSLKKIGLRLRLPKVTFSVERWGKSLRIRARQLCFGDGFPKMWQVPFDEGSTWWGGVSLGHS